MNTFVNAVANQLTVTDNGMKARVNTAKATVDLFYKIGASRGKDITKDFVASYAEDPGITLRIAQWARDVRGGAGEREVYRTILRYLDTYNPDAAVALLHKTAEIGRWDDLLLPFQTTSVKATAVALIRQALLIDSNGLAAKWMPRKGFEAKTWRQALELTPKQYRKLLVELTKVVETKMCEKDWDGINFSHVPSVAATRYKKAFFRHTPKFAEYVQALKSGDPTVKVNAAAVYPYDVLKGFQSMNGTELGHVEAQWNALPNYIGDGNILPLVDVSGSMSGARAGGNASKSAITCLDVAVSLGLYCADKNKGKFKDTFLTFSGMPELITLKGNIIQKYQQMSRSHWEGNTNLHAALKKILEVATLGKVPQAEMPNMLLILSDMQFDSCVVTSSSSYRSYDASAIEMIRQEYTNAGYTAPQVVFWNLNASDNSPVRFDASGVALVSGFSPAILKPILANSLEDFTPENIMLRTIMVPRYDL
jgi:hypothetical protein